jgi:hypothetical protein
VFVADDGSFSGFDGWPDTWTFDGAASSDGFVHPAGTRHVWLNQRPPSGASVFPVGTIIVKEITPPDPAQQAFAMVKRGGDFNSGGADGWEWFSLDVTQPIAPVILWRGTTPPNGDVYGNVPGDDCNGCHGQARANDFVQSAVLQLGNF